ncbi:M56 family metallopeptidase [Streptomyces sp. NPDC087440]|uniref:M56 family metallopeptidase n=1 Tax=Streptomyces sp. NPDC087440 TaxID=3365790 RepID=UPI003827EB9E
MIALLLLPLALPWALAPLGRAALARMRPEQALWTLTAATAVLAAGVVSCLGALLLPLALAFAPVAALAHLIQPPRFGPDAVTLGVSTPATGFLALATVGLVRGTVREVGRLRSVHARVSRLPHAGGLCVLEDSRPDAYALPGVRRGSARIVVTTGMLRSLGAAEREALLAHERTHLRARHHLFLATAQLAGRCHPALVPVVAQVSYAAERAADEGAARSTGSRTLTARAIGRAALATTRSLRQPSSAGDLGQPPPCALTAGATTGPVPARVKELLTQRTTHRIAAPLLALALLCLTAGTSALSGAVLLHHEVEVAQGEHPFTR